MSLSNGEPVRQVDTPQCKPTIMIRMLDLFQRAVQLESGSQFPKIRQDQTSTLQFFNFHPINTASLTPSLLRLLWMPALTLFQSKKNCFICKKNGVKGVAHVVEIPLLRFIW